MSLKARLSQLKSETVEVRGETVTVRELTAGQRIELLEVFRENAAAAMTQVCAMAAVEDGAPIFTAEEAEHLPPDVVDAIASTALRLSGMGGGLPND
jgi:hypothetical protein